MERLHIPKAYLTGFQSLAGLEDSKIQDISKFLQTVPIGTGKDTFLRLFNLAFEDLKPTDIASTIFSIASIQNYDNGPFEVDATADMLVQSYKAQVENAPNTEKLLSNLTVILKSLDSLFYSFKAFRLLSEDKSVFISSHIVSDMRLVFDKNDVSKSERQAVIIHRLKINTSENEKKNAYFFSLDTNDLKRLRDQIDRAEEKDKLIREQYGEMISFVNITD